MVTMVTIKYQRNGIISS